MCGVGSDFVGCESSQVISYSIVFGLIVEFSLVRSCGSPEKKGPVGEDCPYLKFGSSFSSSFCNCDPLAEGRNHSYSRLSPFVGYFKGEFGKTSSILFYSKGTPF